MIGSSHCVFTPEQDNDKTNVEPVHSYDALVRQRRCEKHHRNAQIQRLSCRCLVVVLLWCENTRRALWLSSHAVVHDWVFKDLGMSSRVCETVHIKRSYTT